MKLPFLILLALVGCSQTTPTFEAFPAHEQIALAKFAKTKIPRSGIGWKMESYLSYSDNPEIAHVNFAGYYSVFIVGCGTGCAEYCIIDRSTGEVYPQRDFQQDFPNEWDGPTGFLFRPDSRLFTVYWAEGFDWPIHVEHFVWDGRKMNLVQSQILPKPLGTPEPKLTFGVRPIDMIKPVKKP
ncbi:MAG: hypothetical protein HZA31_00985 [Opitutae bacterium]|nr:hypothetical protein [Opitutae bacterium]